MNASVHNTPHVLMSLRDWSPRGRQQLPNRGIFDASHAPALATPRRRPACRAHAVAMNEQDIDAQRQQDEFYKAPRPVSKRVRELRKKIDRSVASLRDATAALDAPPEMQAELERMRQELLGMLEARQEALTAAAEMDKSSSSSSSSEDEDTLMIKDQSSSTLDQIMQPVTTGSAGRVLVCTGKDCTKRGAAEVLTAFESAVTSPDVKVIACKCLGKCKQAPAARVKVQGASGSALHTRIRPEEAAVLVGTYFVPVPDLAAEEGELIGVE